MELWRWNGPIRWSFLKILHVRSKPIPLLRNNCAILTLLQRKLSLRMHSTRISPTKTTLKLRFQRCKIRKQTAPSNPLQSKLSKMRNLYTELINSSTNPFSSVLNLASHVALKKITAWVAGPIPRRISSCKRSLSRHAEPNATTGILPMVTSVFGAPDVTKLVRHALTKASKEIDTFVKPVLPLTASTIHSTWNVCKSVRWVRTTPPEIYANNVLTSADRAVIKAHALVVNKIAPFLSCLEMSVLKVVPKDSVQLQGCVSSVNRPVLNVLPAPKFVPRAINQQDPAIYTVPTVWQNARKVSSQTRKRRGAKGVLLDVLNVTRMIKEYVSNVTHNLCFSEKSASLTVLRATCQTIKQTFAIQYLVWTSQWSTSHSSSWLSFSCSCHLSEQNRNVNIYLFPTSLF